MTVSEQDRIRMWAEQLRRHHVVIVGSPADWVRVWPRLLDSIEEAFRSVYLVTLASPGIDGYADAAKGVLPMESPIGLSATDMFTAQVLDVQLDWVQPDSDCAIVVQDIGLIEPEWQQDLLNRYITDVVLLEDPSAGGEVCERPSFRILGFASRLEGFAFPECELYCGVADSDLRGAEQVARDWLSIEHL